MPRDNSPVICSAFLRGGGVENEAVGVWLFFFLRFSVNSGEGGGADGVGDGHGRKPVVLPFSEELGFGLMIERVFQIILNFPTVAVHFVASDSRSGVDSVFHESCEHVGVFAVGDADKFNESEREF